MVDVIQANLNSGFALRTRMPERMEFRRNKNNRGNSGKIVKKYARQVGRW